MRSTPATARLAAPAAAPLRWERADTQLAALAVLLAVGARAAHGQLRGAMFNDGPRFIAMAEGFLRGDWSAALSDSFHPLTALGMAALSRALGLPLETAAHALSSAAGGAAALAIYALARGYGRAVAAGAALLVALHPQLVASAAGPQSEGLYLACFVTAACCAWHGLRAQSAALAAAAGAACGLAYLTRPEGLAVALVFGVSALALGARRWRSSAAQLAAFSLALALVAAPYVLALRAHSGVWSLTHKKSLSAMLRLTPAEPAPLPLPPAASDPGAEPAPAAGAPQPQAAPAAAQSGSGAEPAQQSPQSLPPSAATPAPPTSPAAAGGAGALAGVSGALGPVLRDGYRALQPVVLALLLLGLRRGAPEPLTRYLLGYAALFAALLLALQVSAGYVSRRHWFSALVLCTPFAARGALTLWAAALRPLPAALRSRRVATAVLALVVLGFLSRSALPEPGRAKAARREAAQWLARERRPELVAAMRSRDAYYAGAARFVSIRSAASAQLAQQRAQAAGARYLILDLGELPRAQRELAGIGAELHRVAYAGGAVVVLDLAASAGAAAALAAGGSAP